MATSAQHIAARNDNDLLARFIAVAEQLGISNAQAFVELNRGKLVAAEIDGTTISDVHAYAVATYEPTPRPGENPAAVTDLQLAHALEVLTANP